MSKLESLKEFAKYPFGIVHIAAGLASPIMGNAPCKMNPIINAYGELSEGSWARAIEMQFHILRALFGEGLPNTQLRCATLEGIMEEARNRGIKPAHVGLVNHIVQGDEIIYSITELKPKEGIAFCLFNYTYRPFMGAYNFPCDMVERAPNDGIVNNLGVMSIRGEPLIMGWLDKARQESSHWDCDSLEDFFANCLSSFGAHISFDFDINMFRKAWNMAD